MTWFEEDPAPEFDERVQDQLERDVRAAWGSILNSEAGRLVVWSILSRCHIYHTTYTGNADTNFREGERSIGLKILQQHVFPLGAEYLPQMMNEFSDRAERIGIALDQEGQDDRRDAD